MAFVLFAPPVIVAWHDAPMPTARPLARYLRSLMRFAATTRSADARAPHRHPTAPPRVPCATTGSWRTRRVLEGSSPQTCLLTSIENGSPGPSPIGLRQQSVSRQHLATSRQGRTRRRMEKENYELRHTDASGVTGLMTPVEPEAERRYVVRYRFPVHLLCLTTGQASESGTGIETRLVSKRAGRTAAHRLQQQLPSSLTRGEHRPAHKDPHRPRFYSAQSSPGVCLGQLRRSSPGHLGEERAPAGSPGDQPRGVHGRVGRPRPGPDGQIPAPTSPPAIRLCAQAHPGTSGVLPSPNPRDLPLDAAGGSRGRRGRGHQDRQSGRRFKFWPGRHGRSQPDKEEVSTHQNPRPQPAGPCRHGSGPSPSPVAKLSGWCATQDMPDCRPRTCLPPTGRWGRGGLALCAINSCTEILGGSSAETLPLRPARGRPHGVTEPHVAFLPIAPPSAGDAP